MNNDLYNLYRTINKQFDLDLVSYTSISPKSYKVITKDNQKFIIKKIKDEMNSKYSYLKNIGISNIVYPISTKNKRSSFNICNDNEKNDDYCVLPYVDNNNILNQNKVVALLKELEILHTKTEFMKKINIIRSKNRMEEIIEYLNYKFLIIESYIRTIEAQNFDEFSIPILKKYQYILEAKKLLIKYNKKIVKAIKEEKSIYYCFIHNNPKLEHIIIQGGSNFLISLDKGKIGICSLDIAKYYVENQEINFDFYEVITKYFDKYNDEFYYDYFIFLVLFIYIKIIIIESKDYVTTQNFVYSSDCIKKFIKDFKLLENAEKT